MPKSLIEQFGARVVTLCGGQSGLRGTLTCEVKAVDGADPILDFVATDETLDHYGEVVSLAGWTLDNYRKSPVVVDCHDYSSVAKILGKSTDVTIADKKMVNRVKFALDNPLGAMAYKLAKGGFIRSESVGFMPLEWKTGKNADEPRVTFTKQDLLEISLCVVPANPGAVVGLALKSGAITKGDVKLALEALREFSSQEETPATNAGATSGGGDYAQWLQVVKDLNILLKS